MRSTNARWTRSLLSCKPGVAERRVLLVRLSPRFLAEMKHQIAWIAARNGRPLSRKFSINVNGHATPLTAGLAATAEIRTGRRRIIEFLLSPLQRRVEEAGRER
mgnify:CR=1 FL=1